MNKIKTSLSRPENKGMSFVSILPITHTFLACPLFLPFISLLGPLNQQKRSTDKHRITTLFNEINELSQHESTGETSPEKTEKTEKTNLIKESIDRKEDYLFISKLIISGCFRNSTNNDDSTDKESKRKQG